MRTFINGNSKSISLGVSTQQMNLLVVLMNLFLATVDGGQLCLSQAVGAPIYRNL